MLISNIVSREKTSVKQTIGDNIYAERRLIIRYM